MHAPALVILCTAPARGDDAERLARGLVAEKLAACVNLLPAVRSFYVWQGELEDETEVLLVIKSRPEHFERIEAWLQEHHPYDVPEIVALPASRVSESYLAWLIAQTSAVAP